MYNRSQTTIFQFLTQATELDPSVLQLVSVFGDIKRVHYRFPMQTAIMMFFCGTKFTSAKIEPQQHATLLFSFRQTSLGMIRFHLSTPEMNGPPGSLASGFRNPKQTVRPKKQLLWRKGQTSPIFEDGLNSQLWRVRHIYSIWTLHLRHANATKDGASFGKLVGCRPKKKELTYKAFNNQKTKGNFYRIRWISSFCHHELEAVLEQQHLVQWDERADYWIDIIIYRAEDLFSWSTRVF